MKKLLFISMLILLSNNLELKGVGSIVGSIVTGKCSRPGDCASGNCLLYSNEYGNCVAPTNAANGTACNADNQCHSNMCGVKGSGIKNRCNGGLATGARCTLNDDCASVRCLNGICLKPVSAAGGSSAGTSAG